LVWALPLTTARAYTAGALERQAASGNATIAGTEWFTLSPTARVARVQQLQQQAACGIVAERQPAWLITANPAAGANRDRQCVGPSHDPTTRKTASAHRS